MKHARRPLLRTFTTPLLIALLSLTGLLWALLAEGPADLLAGLLVATPLLILVALRRPARWQDRRR
jgi:hypothetical protein